MLRDLLERIDKQGANPEDQTGTVWDADEQRIQVREEGQYDTQTSFYAAAMTGRLGEIARPALPAMRQVLAGLPRDATASAMDNYVLRILEHTIGVLDGKTPALVYPPVARTR